MAYPVLAPWEDRGPTTNAHLSSQVFYRGIHLVEHLDCKHPECRVPNYVKAARKEDIAKEAAAEQAAAAPLPPPPPAADAELLQEQWRSSSSRRPCRKSTWSVWERRVLVVAEAGITGSSRC